MSGLRRHQYRRQTCVRYWACVALLALAVTGLGMFGSFWGSFKLLVEPIGEAGLNTFTTLQNPDKFLRLMLFEHRLVGDAALNSHAKISRLEQI